MKIALFVNGKSRRGRELFERASQEFAQLGVDLTACQVVSRPPDIIDHVKSAIAKGADRIAIGGGDGTLSYVARYFVGSNTAMGILPLGTGNAFARDLNLSTDLTQACKTVVEGHQQSVDLGMVNDDYFVNVATVGFSTQIAKSLRPEEKRRFGKFAYGFALYRAYKHMKPFHVSLKLNEHEQLPTEDEEFDCLQIVIGNGRYHAGPFVLSPDASITEGKLTLYAIQNRSRSALFKTALAIATGTHTKLDDVFSFETTGGTLNCNRTQEVTVDGEVVCKTPLRFRIAPGALSVMVPNPVV